MSSTGFQLDKNFWLHLIKIKAFEPKIKIMVKTAAIYLKQKIFALFCDFPIFIILRSMKNGIYSGFCSTKLKPFCNIEKNFSSKSLLHFLILLKEMIESWKVLRTYSYTPY